MSEKKKKIDYHEFDTPSPEEFPLNPGVASSSELTGLMYRTPVNGEEWGSYQELYSMEIPEADGQMDHTVADQLHGAHTPQEAGRAVENASGSYSPNTMR